MWSRVKKTTGDSRNAWTEYTDSQGSGTGQGRSATFTINLKVKSGSGNVKKPPNIAAKYDAIITYQDNSVYQIPSASFWTTENSAQANFEFTNPYPNKTVKTIQVKWYSYSSTATTCNLTYLGGTPIVLATVTDNPIELTLTADQRAKQVTATYTPKQDRSGSQPWTITPYTGDTIDVIGQNMLPVVQTSVTSRDVLFVVDDQGIVTANGANTSGSSGYIQIPIPSNVYGDLILAGSIDPPGSSTTWQAFVRDNTAGGVAKKWDGTTTSNYLRTSGAYQVQLIQGHTNVIRATVSGGATANDVKFYLMIKRKEDQTTDYVPGYNVEYTPAFSESVYGGTYYAGGAFDEEYVNIASYNGEAINEPWLSSLDEYTPGGTPTTGAQVVYPANQVVKTVAADSLPLDLIEGDNYIFADEADDITLSYEAE